MITRMQAKAFTRELHRKERQGQAGTSQNPKPKTNPTRKHAIKVGKSKDKVIVQSCSDKDTATIVASDTTKSLGRKSTQNSKGDEGLRDEEAQPRPDMPSGFHEYPNPIQEKENLVKSKALVEECQAMQVETTVPVDIKFTPIVPINKLGQYFESDDSDRKSVV